MIEATALKSGHKSGSVPEFMPLGFCHSVHTVFRDSPQKAALVDAQNNSDMGDPLGANF